jgi:hypothetical protein
MHTMDTQDVLVLERSHNTNFVLESLFAVHLEVLLSPTKHFGSVRLLCKFMLDHINRSKITPAQPF